MYNIEVIMFCQEMRVLNMLVYYTAGQTDNIQHIEYYDPNSWLDCLDHNHDLQSWQALTNTTYRSDPRIAK